MKEHQIFDDGDLLQSASPKTLVFNYTRFGLYVICMTPLLMLIDSFQTEKEILKGNLINIWQKRKKTRIVQFKYIDDVHVVAIFFAY